jgi:hypothetical protein
LPRAEIDEDGGLVLDTDDPTEAVPVVGHLVLHIEYLDWRGGRGCVEGTTGQMAPGHGAGWLHYSYYAPNLLVTACLSAWWRAIVGCCGRASRLRGPEGRTLADLTGRQAEVNYRALIEPYRARLPWLRAAQVPAGGLAWTVTDPSAGAWPHRRQIQSRSRS